MSETVNMGRCGAACPHHNGLGCGLKSGHGDTHHCFQCICTYAADGFHLHPDGEYPQPVGRDLPAGVSGEAEKP